MAPFMADVGSTSVDYASIPGTLAPGKKKRATGARFAPVMKPAYLVSAFFFVDLVVVVVLGYV